MKNCHQWGAGGSLGDTLPFGFTYLSLKDGRERPQYKERRRK